MALVTYTLLSALASGLQSRFHPEVLGYSLSKALLVVIGEFCAIKLGCYLLDVRGSGASGVELIGYGGYKFVGYVTPSFPSILVLLNRTNLVSYLQKAGMYCKWIRADLQNHRHCPTWFPKRRTPDFDTSIHLRILCKRLLLSKFKRSPHSRSILICDYTMRVRIDLTDSYVPSNTSFSPIHPKLPQSLLLPSPTLSELGGFISCSSWLVVRSFGWAGYLESRLYACIDTEHARTLISDAFHLPTRQTAR
jgi:hypothetical protein